MNLQSEITEIRTRIAHPYRADVSDSYVLDEEIANWLYQGELQVAHDVHYQALYPLQTEATGTTTTGTAEYTIAGIVTTGDYVRLLGVTYNAQGTATKRYDCAMIQPGEYWFRKQHYSASFYDWPYATVINNKVYVIPPPVTGAANSIAIRYIKRPTRRFKRYRGQITSSASAVRLADTTAAARSWPDDWFNTCKLRFVGTMGSSGEEQVVSDYTGATGDFTLAAFTSAAAPVVGTEFEVGSISDLPDELHPLYLQWATFLAMQKDQGMERAEAYRVVYLEMVKAVNANWQGLLKEVTV